MMFVKFLISAFVAPWRPRGAGSQCESSLSMSSALIVQNKGGGHGELGKMSKFSLDPSFGLRI